MSIESVPIIFLWNGRAGIGFFWGALLLGDWLAKRGRAGPKKTTPSRSGEGVAGPGERAVPPGMGTEWNQQEQEPPVPQELPQPPPPSCMLEDTVNPA